jgi:predicted restriction endonuclease
VECSLAFDVKFVQVGEDFEYVVVALGVGRAENYQSVFDGKYILLKSRDIDRNQLIFVHKYFI